MDITEDSNTNSKNKLTLGSNNGEETLGSQESLDRRHENSNAYSVFYHAAANGQELLRFNSKKNLKSSKQADGLAASPYNTGLMNMQTQQLFQFTRKQNLINAENSLSATRESNSGIKVIKLKKPQPMKISLHRDSAAPPAPP